MNKQSERNVTGYVYRKSEHGPGTRDLWTVGYYKPNGEWEPESDHLSSEAAAQRVSWLNGGKRDE